MVKNISEQIKKSEIKILKFYKGFVSPILKQLLGGGCRFEPVCSDYSILAIEKYGPYKGFTLSLIRFIRCNPLSKHPQKYPLE